MPSASSAESTNMPTLYWDVETRSAVNLRERGAHVYAIDQRRKRYVSFTRSTTKRRNSGCPRIRRHRCSLRSLPIQQLAV